MPDEVEYTFIRSYNHYAHRFELAGGGEIVVPSKFSKPSTIRVTLEQWGELNKCKEFVAMIDAKSDGYKKVDIMPRDQLDVMDRIAEANDKAALAKQEADKAKAEAAKAKEDFEAFKTAHAIDTGANLETAVLKKAEEEKEAAIAELAAIKAEFEKFKAGISATTVEAVVTVPVDTVPAPAPTPEATPAPIATDPSAVTPVVAQ